MPRKSSSVGQKILLLLLAGVALGLAYSPQRQTRIIKELQREWKKIDRKELENTIRQLYKSKIIEACENKDGTSTFVLSEKGKVRALTYKFEEMKINPLERWDGKWRLVAFDVPEKKKPAREALRRKLRELGFHELQKSMFVFPYECKDEVDFIVEFFDMRPYVRYGVLEAIDNDLHLRKIFKLG
jgi:DNA-binding transcriptional regulator PaaX